MIKYILILVLCLPIIGYSQVIHTIDAILYLEPSPEVIICEWTSKEEISLLNKIAKYRMRKPLKADKYEMRKRLKKDKNDMRKELKKDKYEMPKRLEAIKYNSDLSGVLKFQHLVFYDPNLSLTQSYKQGIILSNVIFSSSINYNKYCCNSDEQYKFIKENGIILKWSRFEIGYNSSCFEILFQNNLFRPKEKYCEPVKPSITKVKLFGELIFFKNCDIEVLNLDRQKKKTLTQLYLKMYPSTFF